MVENGIRQFAHDVNIDSDRLNFIVNFYAIAFSGLIIQWLTRGCRDSSEELAATLSKMLQGSFTNAIDNLKNQ